jgi:hypothetical protein
VEEVVHEWNVSECHLKSDHAGNAQENPDVLKRVGAERRPME